MTYCLAIKTDQGLVFASDSRTNAGADQVRVYSKMGLASKDAAYAVMKKHGEGAEWTSSSTAGAAASSRRSARRSTTGS